MPTITDLTGPAGRLEAVLDLPAPPPQGRPAVTNVLTSEQWAQLGTSGLIWLVAPLAVGLALVMRSEVK